jgi:hypothetical protein
MEKQEKFQALLLERIEYLDGRIEKQRKGVRDALERVRRRMQTNARDLEQVRDLEEDIYADSRELNKARADLRETGINLLLIQRKPDAAVDGESFTDFSTQPDDV